MTTDTKQRSLFLREWRTHLGVTVNDLAEKTKTSPAYISRAETGHTNPSLSFLEACATALGITCADLIARPSQERTRILPSVAARLGPMTRSALKDECNEEEVLQFLINAPLSQLDHEELCKVADNLPDTFATAFIELKKRLSDMTS